MFKKSWITWTVAGLIAIGAGWMLYLGSGAEVETCKAEKGKIQDYVELRGQVVLDQKETVYSEVSGKILRINVEAGDKVQADTVLLQLDPRDADLSLDRAYADYHAACIALENLKRHVKPEEIKQAELQITQGETMVQSNQKDYDYKREKLERFRKLCREGAISKQDLKDMEMQVIAAEGALRDAQQRLKIAQSNRDLISKGASKTEIVAAEAEVTRAKVQIEEFKNNRGRGTILAGLKGTVLAKLTEEGAVVQPGTPLFEIGNQESSYIKVDLLSDDAIKLRLGQKAVITGDALNDREIGGEVYYIAPKAVTTLSSLGVEQQRVEVRIRFDNRRYHFQSGYGFDVKLVIREKPNAIYIPEKAVFEMDGRDHVFVIREGKLELRAVKIGIENDDYYEILSGVMTGDRVVVEPDNSLKPGMKVKDGTKWQ
jgi:HlyD family secretion protein